MVTDLLDVFGVGHCSPINHDLQFKSAFVVFINLKVLKESEHETRHEVDAEDPVQLRLGRLIVLI